MEWGSGVCRDGVMEGGEGPWPGRNRIGQQHSFAQARFPSLCNQIAIKGEPPLTHALLEVLQGQPPALSPSSFFSILSCSTFLCLFFLIHFLFLAALGLCCGARASHCGGFSCCGARALGVRTSVVVARGLQ